MRHRSEIRHGLVRRAGRIVAVAVCATAVSVPTGWADARPAGAGPAPDVSSTQDAATTGNVRYYVVGQQPGGERDFLFAIAARTLGDGRRYPEIFDLNVGRTQPDGGRLTDPTVLEPGWVLRLPDDARGPGVRYGPLPAADGVSTGPQLPTVGGARQPDPGSELLLRGGAAMVAVGLFALAVVVLRRGGGRRPATKAVRPASRAVRPASRAVRPASALVPAPATGPAPAADLTAGPAPTSDPMPTTGPPESSAEDDRRLAHLEVRLRVGDDPAVLRLTGLRRPRGDTPYGWRSAEPDTDQPGSETTLDVGTGTGGQFWIELRQAPDVLAVTGSADARERVARLLATRLLAAGAAVTVVGDGLTTLPPGCRRYPADLPALADDDAARTVVTLVTDPAPSQLAALAALVERPTPATVPIVVTAGPPARWTLQIVDG
ncbi:LysM peptidoglycan-binding domain-containing protein [Solwaraspora sp. WMMB762]|uniref:LysM peptidoglycan-binding domain-containing protein n=1 Tax=Solwaraspora sp. WMMB762 TaxID=3404120 RepID=UPI003B95BB55